MYGLVDEHRAVHGVEPICAVLQIAPSAYRRHAARCRDQALLSARAQRDVELMPMVEQVWNNNLQVYGAGKVWKQMNREGVEVARCTVERLMRRLGLRGVKRGKVVRTTISDSKAPCPLDKVSRNWLSTTIEEFVAALDAYIHWYNEARIKMALGFLCPTEHRRSLGIAV